MTVHPEELDARFRAAAFAYVRGLLDAHGGLVTRQQLEAFEFEGRRAPLIERQRGIRKISWLDAAISILTTYVSDPRKAPYEDAVGADSHFRYKWQGTDPNAFDNRALRLAKERGLQLMWFQGVQPGVYEVDFVWLVDEEREHHQFVLALDDLQREMWGTEPWKGPDQALQREYADRMVRQRKHQRGFRVRVLAAYANQCALCRLQHVPLLDAAHIKEDKDGGEPIVPNGIAMCAIHHRAFDADVLGIRPDFIVQVQPQVLLEKDGPTLQHALQGVHGVRLQLPRQAAARPDALLLEERFSRFLKAG